MASKTITTCDRCGATLDEVDHVDLDAMRIDRVTPGGLKTLYNRACPEREGWSFCIACWKGVRDSIHDEMGRYD